MRSAIFNLKKFIAIQRHCKSFIFQFIESDVLPSDGCTIIAKQDYHTLGILNSKFHVEWIKYTSSNCLKEQIDIVL